MKTKYISAIVVLGSTLAIVHPCSAMVSTSPQLYPAMAPPAKEVPAGYVWDGTKYVGQVGGKYYYVGPQNTWLVLDTTRQPSAEQRQINNPNWMGNTRSTGPAMEQYPSGQPSQMGNTGYQGNEVGQYPSWSDPNAQSSQIRNTRYTGHDMGQTHAPAPPLPENPNTP